MTLDDAIATLYVREFNCGCETFWDGSIRVWIGDRVNGRSRMGISVTTDHSAHLFSTIQQDRAIQASQY